MVIFKIKKNMFFTMKTYRVWNEAFEKPTRIIEVPHWLSSKKETNEIDE